MLARIFEEAGLTAVAIVLIKEHAARVKPPRALFVPFPFGFALGKPDDPAFQHQVIKAALELLSIDDTPVLAEFPEDGEGSVQLIQASAVLDRASLVLADPADEVTSLRTFYERWVENHAGRTQVGISGIPQRRFRGMIRFLQAYAHGDESDAEERPQDIAQPQFVRWCIDDLKAFYYEAQMARRPGTTNDDLHKWFWSTAAGRLAVDIAKHMDDAGDSELQEFARGIAR